MCCSNNNKKPAQTKIFLKKVTWCHSQQSHKPIQIQRKGPKSPHLILRAFQCCSHLWKYSQSAIANKTHSNLGQKLWSHFPFLTRRKKKMCVCLEISCKCSQETVDNNFFQGMRLEIQGGGKKLPFHHRPFYDMNCFSHICVIFLTLIEF